MSEKRLVVDDCLGDFGFHVLWNVSDTWADFTVYEVVARQSPDSSALYYKKGWQSSDELVLSVDAAEAYGDGFIKWDGCSESNFPKWHFCGARDFKKHIALLEWLYKRAGELMASADMEAW